jgi:hypothetical protein
MDYLEALKELYRTSSLDCFINDLDFLLKYESIEKGFIVVIVQIIVDRAKSDPLFAHALSLIFNEHTEINKQLVSLFSSNTALLEDAYIRIDQIELYADYDGSTFSRLLDSNPSFIYSYLEDKFSKASYLSQHDNHRDYSFIWLRMTLLVS